MKRAPKIVLAVLAAAVVLGGLGWYFFAPKPSTRLDDPLPEDAADAVTLKQGAFMDGEPLHHASGTVKLLRKADGSHLLRFEGYEATAGPDVYFYLTPKAHATTTGETEGEGLQVRTPTMMGQATLRGSFNLDLPADFDPARYEGLAAWCDTYNVLFGYAELAPAAR